jgi:hypothetical protein
MIVCTSTPSCTRHHIRPVLLQQSLRSNITCWYQCKISCCSLFWAESMDDATQPTIALALCQCPHAQHAAVYRLALASVTLQPCTPHNGIELEDLTAEVVNDMRVLSTNGVIMLTSRLTNQSSLYQLVNQASTSSGDSNRSDRKDYNSSTALAAGNSLVPYPGQYVQDEYTIGLFAMRDQQRYQVTSRAIALCGATIHRVEIGTLLNNACVASVPKMELNAAGSLGSTAAHSVASTLPTEGSITFAASLDADKLLLALRNVVLVVSVNSSGAAQVWQMARFASEICGLVTSGTTAQRSSDVSTVLVCVSLWNGTVVLLRSNAEGQLSCIHCIPAAAEGVLVRHMAATTLYYSSELTVHALMCGVGRSVVAYHVTQSNSSGTNISIAKTLVLRSTVHSIIPPASDTTGSAAFSAIVRTRSGDRVLRCDVTLLDGCERQVPLIEWYCNALVQPIGVSPPVMVFPIEPPFSFEATSMNMSPRQGARIPIGWITAPASDITEVAQLHFGMLDTSNTDAHITAMTALRGTVASIGISPDERHLLVLTNCSVQQRRICGHATVDAGELSVYDATTLQCRNRQPVSSLRNFIGTGHLVGALCGPQPARQDSAGGQSSHVYVSYVSAVPGAPRHNSAGSLGTTSLQISTFRYPCSTEHPAGTAGNITEGALVGSLFLQCKATNTTVLSASAATARELPPPQSTLVHFKALSAEQLVMCMADNVLRLVGWAGVTSEATSNLLELREIFTLQLENKVRTSAHLFGCK